MDKAAPQRAPSGGVVKREVKDSVFSDLFGIKRYLLQLYRTLHPEDETTAEDDLVDVTIDNVLTDDLYNDLSFMVGDRLMVLVEAQSTWTANIVVRALLYLAQVWKDYFARTRADLYHSGKVKLPKPELYVIYTGERASRPGELSLSGEFFGGERSAVEVRIRMLYGEGGGDIVSQYVAFCRIFNEQARLYGLTEKALRETIRLCRDRDVLKEYLERREREVTKIMSLLFDQETVTRIREERLYREAMAEGKVEGKAEGKAEGKVEGRAEGEAEGKVQGSVNTCRSFGLSYDETVVKLAEMFGIPEDDARVQVARYWDAREAAPAD